MDPLAERVARLDWRAAEESLAARGYALPGGLLAPRECEALRALFDEDARFRTTVEMAPKRYGVGRYRYFAYPLPPVVAALREALYPPLAAIANHWQEQLRRDERFEPTLDAFLARCARAGQRRPTPLLLRYGPGGYNRLHQDRYGAVSFPLQVAIGLSRPGEDYDGGEFLLVEQAAREQGRGHAIALAQGEAIVFPNALRPVASARGHRRANVRHGVAELRRGERFTLGLIFHDAE
jgi:hypothetical protein